MQRRTKFIILGAYYLSWVIFGFVVALFSTPICLRPTCVDKTAGIVRSMNPAISPCKDFYKFVCGGAPTVLIANATDEPYESVYAMMVGKLSQYSGETRSGVFSQKDVEQLYHEKMIGKFYGMCEKTDRDNYESLGADIADKLHQSVIGTNMAIRDIFSEKTFNHSISAGIYEVNLKRSGFLGESLFTSEIARDFRDPDNFVLYIGKPIFFINIPVGTFEAIPTNKWPELIPSLLMALVPSTKEELRNPDNALMDLMTNFTSLWWDLNHIFRIPESKAVKAEAVRIDEMQKRFPDLDFDGFLRSIGAPKKNRHHLYIQPSAQTYFAKLKNILDKYSRQTIVFFQLLQSALDVSPFVAFPTKIAGAIEPIGSLATAGDQCKKMLGNRFGGMALSLVIERFRLERNDPEAVVGIFEEFLKGMKARLHKTSWMDSATRTSGIDKLGAVKRKLSLSKPLYDSVKTPGKRAEYFNGLCLMRTVLLTLMCMNRFFARKNFGLYTRPVTGFDDADAVSMSSIKYHQNENEFSVPILILRFPAFETSWPEHINYGGIGVEVASEITTGFDFEGSKRDKFGLERRWWSNKTYDNYKKLELNCEKLFREAEKKSQNPRSNVTNPKSLTDDELKEGVLRRPYWKYLMGVKLAYNAYVAHKKTLTYRESRLPGIEMYPTEQMFFISHAQSRCLPPLRPGADEELRKNTQHYFQAMSSTKEFNDAFKCPSKKTNRKAEVLVKAVNKCTLF